MDKVQLAYTAGILDGEGHLSITRETCKTCIRGWRHRVLIVVANTNLKLINRLRDWYGGKISVSERPSTYRAKRCYYWKIQAVNEQKEFLKKIEPYLFLKREQAKTMMDFMERVKITGLPLEEEEFQRREDLCKKIQKLNFRGNPIVQNDTIV